ncbi:RluA family pseudouridine synthase [Candidatus Gracilibacteria bacterium 28_42_T64]|nr:RluA family pseudouridine synthase [Candidatus Gracilibacteria bacterium 28_42_T64]
MIYNFCVLVEKQIRVDIFLSTLFKDFSRSYVQKLVDRGQVSVNGVKVNKNIKISNHDEIKIEIQLEKLEVEPEKMDLDIVFEDKEIIILNKNPRVNVHPVPGENGKTGTLVNGLLYHCKDNLPSIGGVERPGIVHRLDKDTTGAIMIAKTDKMMNYLSGIIKNRQIDKYYIAIVHGKIKDRNFKIESFIGRHKDDRTKMTTLNPIAAKEAITYGEVLDYVDNKYSVLRIKLETGRTHQIRVHLASIGYPILGDSTYGNVRVNKEVATMHQIKRQALHAYELGFELYGEKRVFRANLKDDMKKMIGDIVE